MTWILLLTLVLGLAAALLALRARRSELERLTRGVEERRAARERGSHRARLEHPLVDDSRCIGCGLCVSACPEEGVLDVIHGQAVVVHGARCVGHGRCAEACPVGAIALTLGDVSERRDLPAIDASLEVPGRPGVFLAGEVTGRALVRTAITHGSAVAREVARRKDVKADGALDLCIVGAGPAGLACALEAKAQGLSFVVIERDLLGGTVAHYPRRKLVMTQPVDLPLHGRLSRLVWSKEELIELWQSVALEHALPIRTGLSFEGLEPVDGGGYVVRTSGASVPARNVCIALGRRGTPRRLGVPGEELSKVAYSLADAQSYAGRRALVVGGGDSAIEAALGLSEQPGTDVTLSYRGKAFNRLKARNEARVRAAIERGRIRCLYESRVRRVDPDAVEIDVGPEGTVELVRVANDDVFVFAGGVPPFALLEQCGVSFDPAARPQEEARVEGSSGLGQALTLALGLALVAFGWVLLRRDYYGAPLALRVDSAWHALLRPAGAIGLGFGLAATLAMLANLAYLARRSLRVRFEWGSLRHWMTAHVTTGFLALVCALPHAGMLPRDTVGGHALIGLCVLVATGAIGRYLYAFVPRAANGRELAHDEARARLDALSTDWERDGRPFAAHVRARVNELVSAAAWQTTFWKRLGAVLSGERRLRAALVDLRAEGRRDGIPEAELLELSGLARRAHRAALAAAHLEDLRGLLATWRYLHRWVALLVVLLVVVHIASALRYADLFSVGGAR